jgi:hypothetical protein
MSIKAINWALELSIPPTPKLVLVVIADYADDKGYAFPGADTIARRASISERTLTRVLADLEANGYLERERRSLINGNRTSDGYHLLPDGTSRHFGALSRRQNEGDKTPTVAPVGEPSVEPPVTTPRARARRMPEGMTWTNAHSLKAVAKGVDVEVEFHKFTDYHLAKGSTFVDWDRAFHTWLNNARPDPGFGQHAVTGGPRVSPPRRSRDDEIKEFLGGSLGLDNMQKGIER